MSEEIEFQWDDLNTAHVRRHKVQPNEVEEVLLNEPFGLEYQGEDGEERYKSVGATNGGRVLVVVWTIRNSKLRAITAYPAGRRLQKLVGEMRGKIRHGEDEN